MKKIDVNIRFVILGIFYVFVLSSDSLAWPSLLWVPVVLISTINAIWALGGLLKSFPDFAVKNKLENNKNIIYIYLKIILNIFLKFLLAMLSLSLPFLIYLYFKS